MKKLISSFLATAALLFSPHLWAPINPIGVDTTTGQQKISSVSVPDSGLVLSPDNSPQGLYNICFAQGADSSQLKITSCSAGAALSSSNPGSVRLRSSTAATWRTFNVTADVTIDLTNAHWGLDTKGNTTGSILRVYAADDNNALRWGVGYQGGFYYIRNTQDDTTGSNINLPEEILVNSGVGTDNSPMLYVGWILANFTDSSNEWAITEYHPNESADAIWQPWLIVEAAAGWSSFPTVTQALWMSIGKTVFYKFVLDTNSGTSDSVAANIAGPIAAQNSGGGIDPVGLLWIVEDNGVESATPGYVHVQSSGSTQLNCAESVGSTSITTWNASGNKSFRGNGFYTAFQP